MVKNKHMTVLKETVRVKSIQKEDFISLTEYCKIQERG